MRCSRSPATICVASFLRALRIDAVRVVDVEDVGVGPEAQLGAAEASHRDDREIQRLIIRWNDLTDHRTQGRLDRRLGDLGERRGDLLDS